MTIEFLDIAKIQHLYVEIFEEEDQDYVDRRKIVPKERVINKLLNKFTPDKELQDKIYKAIMQGSWNTKDGTYKTMCDEIRSLGFNVVDSRLKEAD